VICNSEMLLSNVTAKGVRLAKLEESLTQSPPNTFQIRNPLPPGEGRVRDNTVELGGRSASPCRPAAGARPMAAKGCRLTDKETVEYVKISPRVPKDLKKRVDIALVYERFADKEGNTIKTLDEIVAHALEKLLA